jgi:hypothetical protein
MTSDNPRRFGWILKFLGGPSAFVTLWPSRATRTLQQGLEVAREGAASKAERQAIDAAAAVMSEEKSGLGITHAGFAMTALPHKRIDEAIWERQRYRVTLLIESGLTRQKQSVGMPFGSVARLILLYLQTEAIRTGNPEVVLGRSLNRWIERMNLTPGSKTRQLVTEQARRISACRLTFFSDRAGGGELRHNGAFVRDAISLAGVIDDASRICGRIVCVSTTGFTGRCGSTLSRCARRRSEPSARAPWPSMSTCGWHTAFTP